jgi:putative photosynthetic complex assembly protein 2
VRKVNVEFVPRPLAHLPSHFREARMNWLFPTSVTLLTFAVFGLGERALLSEGGTAVGATLLATLCALALLEHWFMIVRLPDEKLWRWMLPETKDHLEEGHDAVR